MKKNELKNKNILVTGATSGIGKGVCLDLLSQGARVIGIGRDKKKVDDLASSFDKEKFLFISYDLNNVDGIEELVKNNLPNQEKLDGLVLCAGKEETVPLSMYKEDKIKSIFNINLFSGIELLRIFSKKKFSNDNSSVVFFSSVMGELGQPGKVGYCATKSAVLGVVKSASLELAKRKIRVNAVSPGIVATPMTKKLFSQLSEENVSEIEEMHPLGIGQIEDVTPVVLFLLSNVSKWITGQNIKIDGGYSVQ
ncbi:SDR family NAD(P)-dependent oxidoreductase [Allomuricauda sp. R78024]|uniref:SDR family NAD(P)-dependent oxidoreductase n=1 Tax=Allomuricauda sp. R78024 TaxID=3093867 RepID=UPI0037CB6029